MTMCNSSSYSEGRDKFILLLVSVLEVSVYGGFVSRSQPRPFYLIAEFVVLKVVVAGAAHAH